MSTGAPLWLRMRTFTGVSRSGKSAGAAVQSSPSAETRIPSRSAVAVSGAPGTTWADAAGSIFPWAQERPLSASAAASANDRDRIIFPSRGRGARADPGPGVVGAASPESRRGKILRAASGVTVPLTSGPARSRTARARVVVYAGTETGLQEKGAAGRGASPTAHLRCTPRSPRPPEPPVYDCQKRALVFIARRSAQAISAAAAGESRADGDRLAGAGIIELEVRVGPILEVGAGRPVEVDGLHVRAVRPTVSRILGDLDGAAGRVRRDGDVGEPRRRRLERDGARSDLADDRVEGGLERGRVGRCVVARASPRLSLTTVDGHLVQRGD